MRASSDLANIAFNLRCKCAHAKISANIEHLFGKTPVSQAFRQHAPAPQVDQHKHLDKHFAVQQQTKSILSPVASNQIPIAVLRENKRPNTCHEPYASSLEKRNARCAPCGQPGQPITKPLFRRRLDWLAMSSKLDELANQSHSKRGREQQAGSGVQTSKLAPSAPSIPEPTPRPILKFARPTPIPTHARPKHASTINRPAS